MRWKSLCSALNPPYRTDFRDCRAATKARFEETRKPHAHFGEAPTYSTQLLQDHVKVTRFGDRQQTELDTHCAGVHVSASVLPSYPVSLTLAHHANVNHTPYFPQRPIMYLKLVPATLAAPDFQVPGAWATITLTEPAPSPYQTAGRPTNVHPPSRRRLRLDLETLKMRNRLTLTSLAASLLIASGGCSLTVPTTNAVKIQQSPTTTQSDRAMQIDIENRNGSVSLSVEPRLTKPVVEAVVWDESGKFMKQVDEKVVKTWYVADIITQNGRPVMRVLTSRDESKVPAFVKLVIRVPSCDGIRVRNTGGDVTLKGVSGPITVENGFRGGIGGDVTISTQSRVSDDIKVTTTKGDVMVHFTPNSQGKIEITSLKGRVEFAARTEGVTHQKRTANTSTAILNGGKNLITLSTQEGTARLDIGEFTKPTEPGEGM